jgi:tetratricopeptide (TPR) repeat protein
MRRVLALALAGLVGGCAARSYREAGRRMDEPFATLEYLRLALAANPDDEPSIDLLAETARRIVATHAATVARLEATGAFEEAVAQCDRVEAARALVASLPRRVEIAHDPLERARLAKEAAEKLDARGLVALEEGRIGAATLDFDHALALSPGLEAARRHLRRAHQTAPLRLELFPFDALASDASGLTASLTRETIEEVARRIPERLLVFPAGERPGDAPFDGSCHGAIQSVTFRGGDWVPRKGKNERATWTVLERRNELTLTVTLHAEKTGTGASLAALVVTRTASDARSYVTFEGDEKALPPEVAALPRAPTEPRGVAELRSLAVTLAAEALGRGLIEAIN